MLCWDSSLLGQSWPDVAQLNWQSETNEPRLLAHDSPLQQDLVRLRNEPQLASTFIGAWHEDELLGLTWLETFSGQVGQIRTPAIWPVAPERGSPAQFSPESDPEEILKELLQSLEQTARTSQLTWLQMVLEADSHFNHDWLQVTAWQHLANLSYQVAIPTSYPMPQPKSYLNFTRCEASQMDLLKQLISQTYINTLDCPALEGRRSLEQVVAGYAEVGQSGKEHWWLAWYDGKPVGCVLLARHLTEPTHADRAILNQGDSFAELVYWGLIPAARGQGFGRELVEWSLWQARLLEATQLVLAVDRANEPALRIYERLGFWEWTQRSVWGKSL